jgi:hypothetical protein
MAEGQNQIAIVAKRRRWLSVELWALGLCLFFGILYEVVPWYYCYFDLRNQMVTIIKNGAIESDEELKIKLAAMVSRAGVKRSSRDFVIERSSDAIRAHLRYTESCAVTVMGQRFQLFSKDFNLSANSKIR